MDLAPLLEDATKKEKKKRSKLPSQVWVKRCHTHLWLSNKKNKMTTVRSYTALRVQDASLRCHVDVSPSTTQMIMNKCCPHTVSPLIISPVTSRFTTERFLLCASGGEERLGGLCGRRRGYGSFRKEINNKPPAARPQTAWIILRLINWLLHGRPCWMMQPLYDKVIHSVHDDSSAPLLPVKRWGWVLKEAVEAIETHSRWAVTTCVFALSHSGEIQYL